MLISHSRWRINKENQLVRKYIERKNMEIIKKIRQQLVEIKHNSRLLTYLWYVCRMPKFMLCNRCIEKESRKRAEGKEDKRFDYIKTLKNSHLGDRCFIVATGPSLTIEDLEKISGEFTFGMNSICKIYGETSWRPSIYGIQDENVYGSMEDDILHWYGNANNILVSDVIAKNFVVPDNFRLFPLNRAYHDNQLEINKYFCKFSEDCFSIIYDGYSITYSLIQLAIYMGFKEIFLLGTDCSYKKGEKNHFIESGFVDKNAYNSYNRMMSGYYEIKKYVDSHNISVVNCTRGGQLEIFHRRDLDDVLKD